MNDFFEIWLVTADGEDLVDEWADDFGCPDESTCGRILGRKTARQGGD